ncbi:MAG: hypothetical protein ACI37T_02645 [Candidatus Gastranaerophilaceae bacterium]
MGNLIKLIILAAVCYGIYWTTQNVDFNSMVNDATQKIENEKTITRVVGGRQRHIETAREVAE